MRFNLNPYLTQSIHETLATSISIVRIVRAELRRTEGMSQSKVKFVTYLLVFSMMLSILPSYGDAGQAFLGAAEKRITTTGLVVNGGLLEFAGVFFTSWGTNAYSEPSTSESLQLLRQQVGPGWLSIPIVWEMPNKTATEIRRSGSTVSNERLVETIQIAQSMGFKIKLHLLCDSEDGTWRAQIEPANWHEWFKNYRTFVNTYGQIAEEYGVQMISVGAELRSSVGFEMEWRETIRQVREEYHGLLVYGANHDSSYKPGAREWNLVKWWDALDYAGIDGYFELAKTSNPTMDELITSWEEYGTEIQTWQATIGKPVIMDEIGYKSEVGGNLGLTYKSGIYDSEVQSNCIESFFRVFWNKVWFAGVFWWGWSFNPSTGGEGDLSIILNNKPAAQTLKNWFSSVRH